jgi:hypothetical protein
MEVRCPYCQHGIEVAAGGQFTCEKCRAIFRVDFDAPAAPPPAESAAAPAPAAAAEPPPAPAAAAPPAPTIPPGARCARHPEQEAIAVCARCGNFTCGACAVLLPAGRHCPDCAERVKSLELSAPWEKRRELGFGQALRETWRGVCFGPTRFFSRMPRTGGYEGPVLYLIIGNFVSTLAVMIPMMVGTLMLGAQSAGGSMGGMDPQLLKALASSGIGGGIAQLVFSPIVAILAAFVSGGMMHLGLMVTGGAKNGFEATLRAYCYQAGSFAYFNVLALPLGLAGVLIGASQGPPGILVGMYAGQAPFGLLALFWGLPVLVIGLREAHETTTLRALGFLLIPLVIGCCCGIAYVGIIAAVISGRGG